MDDCFAHERKVFSECRDDWLENELQTVAAAITAKSAALVDEIGALTSVWLVPYTVNELSSGAKTATQLTQAATKEVLASVLFEILLTLALQTLKPGVQPKIEDYFEQSLFQNASSSEEAEEPPPGS